MKIHLHAVLSITLVALGATILSCENATENTNSYFMKTIIEPNEAGTVSPSGGAYEVGEAVQLTATPQKHWKFVRWEGDFTGTANPTGIIMNGDKEVSALFLKREYPLNLNIQGEGTVTENITEPKATDYEGGTRVQLIATAGEGWHFARWEGDLQGSENPATLEIDKEKNEKPSLKKQNSRSLSR